jgi:hypothetical protein
LTQQTNNGEQKPGADNNHQNQQQTLISRIPLSPKSSLKSAAMYMANTTGMEHLSVRRPFSSVPTRRNNETTTNGEQPQQSFISRHANSAFHPINPPHLPVATNIVQTPQPYQFQQQHQQQQQQQQPHQQQHQSRVQSAESLNRNHLKTYPY